MRRLGLFIIAIIALSLTLPQLLSNNTAQQSATGSVLQLIDTDPLEGQELGLDDTITLYFDRELDCDAMQSAFSITPAMGGSLVCQSNQLQFLPDPNTGFERANAYRITIDQQAIGTDGAQLLDPITLEFLTVGFVAVSETFPSPNAQDVEIDSKITVIFNRPVVALTILEERDTLPSPITFDPAVEGVGEWLNTSIYVFTPDALAGGVQYTAMIAAGLTSTDGAVLPQDYTFSFATQPPALTEFMPYFENGGAAGTDARVQARFNQAMNRQSAEANFRLHPVENPQALVSGTFEWADDNQGFAFQPDEDLQLATLYQAGFSAPVESAVGGEPLQPTTWTFGTVPFPSIISTTPFDGEADVNPYYGSVQIDFASPMNEDTLAEYISISPEPVVEPQFFYRSWSDTYEVSFPLEPSTTYTVNIDPGMEDVYGNATTERMNFTFTTRPYDPEVRLNVPAPIGFYNAYREPTQVFVTYRNMGVFDLALYDVPLETFGRRATDRETYYYDFETGFAPSDQNLIRQWQIDGTNIPENALRYDLLEFTQNTRTGGVDCPSALPPQFSVGDAAIVITEPDPVRARSAPQTGEIVDLLYRDYALTIVGEPTCGTDGLRWVPVRLRDGSTAFVAESVGEEYLIAPVDGTSAPIAVVNEDGSALAPGLYYLRSTPPNFRSQGHVMVVATANIVTKNSIDAITMWVTDSQSGQPLPNQPITVYGAGYSPIGQGVTDANGFLQLDMPRIDDLYERRLAVLDTPEHFGLGWSEWSDGIEPYQFNANFDFYPSQYRIYVYTDRPVYRPGQPVYFRGIVREKDDVLYTRPTQETILVEIRDDRGDLIFSEDLPINQFGSFSGQIDIADDTNLGNYYINAEMPSRQQYYRDAGGVNFAVAEYRLPEFQVEVTPEESEVVQNDTISVTIDSTYFFGGAVSNAEVEYNVIGENYFFEYDGQGRYDFIDYNYDAGPSAFFASSERGTIASGVETTNEQGEVTIEIPAELGDVSQSQQFVIEALVRDESDQVVAGRTTVVVHQGEVYVGARPDSYVTTEGDTATINLIATDWDSEGVSNQELDIEVVRRRWYSVQEKDASGRTTWTYEVEEIPVTTGIATTGENGQSTFDFVPEEGGSYKVYVTTRDELGNEVQTSTFVWVSSRAYVPWRQQNSNRIELVIDQDNYNIGDTAQILITSPFQGETKALVTVERGDVLTSEIITMDTNSFVYELPITADFAPNAFVSVVIIKGVDETNPVAAFRMGYIGFNVESDRRELNIDITSDVDQASPQQTVNYTVRTTDWQGNPVSAEVGVGVTDLASLSLADSNSRPISNFFFGDQMLAVRTSMALTVNTDQLTQETIDTVKGGGGGGGADGLVEVRGEFVDTSYWNPSVITDDNGMGTFDVRLPDNLTTWRLDARAITLAPDGNMLAGQETFDLLSTKPIIIRPVTPRFFVVGDEVVLAAVINNNTGDEQTAVVSINATGVTLQDEAAQMVTIPAGGRARVEWRATVENTEFARMSFIADAGEFSDGSISGVSIDDEGTLPIYRYEAPETVGTAGVLQTTDTRVESIALPQRFDVTQGTLTIQVDQSLAATTLDGLDYLRNYPHQCTEQTISRFLPNIMTVRALQDLQLADDTLQTQLDYQVSFGLQKLFAEQHSDGGWGWFVRSDSDTLVTSYVLIGLYEAQVQGYRVPERIIDNAQEYLSRNFSAPSVNQSYSDANRQAFMLYALARSGEPDTNRAAAQYEFRDNLSVYGKALLAETFFYINPADTSRSDVLLSDLANDAIASAAGVHWDDENDFRNWSTDTRTTAMVLSAFVKLRPNSDLVPNIVRYLVTQRSADAWENTQETAWAVMALTDFMRISGELQPNYDYTVTFNGQTRLEGTASPQTVRNRDVALVDVSEMLQGVANELIFTRTDGNQGNLYYTAYLETYLPAAEVEALDNGIIVQRSYSLQDDPDGRLITEARVGDVVEVRLTVILPNSRHYVVIESPHPAGAEAIDPNLNTSQQIGTRPGLDNDDPTRYGWGWWYFDQTEFRDESVSIYATYLPAGTYEYVYTLRMGFAGEFNVIPATAQEFYYPDVYGRSDGMMFTILPDDE